MVELLSTRLQAEQCGEIRQLAGLIIVDAGEAFALELRRGIAEFHPELPVAAVETIRLARRQLVDLFIGKVSLADLVERAPPGGDSGKPGQARGVRLLFRSPGPGGHHFEPSRWISAILARMSFKRAGLLFVLSFLWACEAEPPAAPGRPSPATELGETTAETGLSRYKQRGLV